RLEQAAGFEVDEGERQRLSTKKRPKQIAEWIRGGRGTKSKQTPKIKSVSKFAEEWDAWWDSIQPSWRKRDANGKRIVGGEYGKDWGQMDCSGPNGCLSAAAGLYFWGLAVSGSGDESARSEWECAVQDVVWVLEGMRALYK
ncbi:hypothetical protein FB451DRAFT_1047773, partial [Mycena latifolia]